MVLRVEKLDGVDRVGNRARAVLRLEVCVEEIVAHIPKVSAEEVCPVGHVRQFFGSWQRLNRLAQVAPAPLRLMNFQELDLSIC